MKYFWYYNFRMAYRNANYRDGFFVATLGHTKTSKNKDYCVGYTDAVDNLQAQAEEHARLNKQLKQAEAHIVSMQKRVELVKRSVVENL